MKQEVTLAVLLELEVSGGRSDQTPRLVHGTRSTVLLHLVLQVDSGNGSLEMDPSCFSMTETHFNQGDFHFSPLVSKDGQLEAIAGLKGERTIAEETWILMKSRAGSSTK